MSYSGQMQGSARRHVVVVGGGVVGCAIAYQLSREGMAVTLLERDAVAAHASGHNAGNLNPLYLTPPALIPLALDAFAIHRDIRAELAQLGAPVEALPVRRLHLGFDAADRQHLEQTATLFATTPGFTSAWLDQPALRQHEPRLADDVAFGVVTEGNLTVDSADFTRALADGATRLGARILTAAASGIVAQGDQVTGIRIGADVVSCDAAVLATGPWVAAANAWFGMDIEIEPVKGELLLMRLPDGAPRFDVTWGHTCLYRRRQDEVWVGSTMTKCGFDAAPSPETRTTLLDRAARILPAMRGAALLDHVAGLRPMASGNLPVADRAPGWRNVYVANGAGTKGVLLCGAMARAIRDRILQPHRTSTLPVAAA